MRGVGALLVLNACFDPHRAKRALPQHVQDHQVTVVNLVSQRLQYLPTARVAHDGGAHIRPLRGHIGHTLRFGSLGPLNPKPLTGHGSYRVSRGTLIVTSMAL